MSSLSDSKGGGGSGAMGMNMVTTVMAFSVSAFFVLFVFVRLLCARLHLRADHAAAHAGDAFVVQANDMELGIRGLEPAVGFPTVKLGDGTRRPQGQEEAQLPGVPGRVRGQGRGARAPRLRPRLPRRLHRRLAQAAADLPRLPRLHARHRKEQPPPRHDARPQPRRRREEPSAGLALPTGPRVPSSGGRGPDGDGRRRGRTAGNRARGAGLLCRPTTTERRCRRPFGLRRRDGEAEHVGG